VNQASFPGDARFYLRPTGFVEAPFGHDGQLLRLAGGLLWFSAVELIVRVGGRRVAQALIPVTALDRLPEAARPLLDRLTAARPALHMGGQTIRFDQPHIMAILNLTPDSFSDGGRITDPDAGAATAVAQAAAGASIIDIGGESTRPGAAPVWEGDEIARVVPVVERLRHAGVALSIDTRKAAVMEAALVAGAHLVNDVSALLHDPRSAEVVAASAAPVVLMHHQGDPATMQTAPRYDDVLLDVYDWLEARVAAAAAAGIDRARIIVDPGIGFGKTLAHNLALLNGLALFHGLGLPLLVGASRKRMIGALSNEAPVDQRLGGSVALVVHGLSQGVQILRVHDVVESRQALRVWRGLRDAALTPPR